MRTYLVGGAVRDKLLGYPCHEKDWVVVGATPQQMLDRGFKAVGKDFPVFLHPETGEEYALARTERKTAPGYTGFQFYSAPDVSLEEDLRRRDLTINAIAEDETGHLVDPYGGSADIQHKTLRHVSDAFCEDPVRILRVARFIARYHHLGFTIAVETLALMRQMVASGEVDHLVPERVWKELSRALGERYPEMFIHTLRECGALARVMPELDQLFKLPWRHEAADSPNRGEQALRVLHQACHLSANTAVRFAALIHNLGNGRHLAPITALCERLAVPKEPRDLALAVAEHHGQSHRALQLEGKALLNLLHTLDAFRRPQKFERFLLCCEADALARPHREQWNYPQAAHLCKALEICLGIEAREVSQDGFRGKRLGEELRRRRAIALERHRQTWRNEISQ